LTYLPHRPLDHARFSELMAHSRYREVRGDEDGEGDEGSGGADGADGADGAEGPSVVHVVNSSAEAQEMMRRWRGSSDDDSPQY